jgi:hypothetical protein
MNPIPLNVCFIVISRTWNLLNVLVIFYTLYLLLNQSWLNDVVYITEKHWNCNRAVSRLHCRSRLKFIRLEIRFDMTVEKNSATESPETTVDNVSFGDPLTINDRSNCIPLLLPCLPVWLFCYPHKCMTYVYGKHHICLSCQCNTLSS